MAKFSWEPKMHMCLHFWVKVTSLEALDDLWKKSSSGELFIAFCDEFITCEFMAKFSWEPKMHTCLHFNYFTTSHTLFVIIPESLELASRLCAVTCMPTVGYAEVVRRQQIAVHH